MGKSYRVNRVNARQSRSERREKYADAKRIGWSSSAARRMRDYPYEFRCTPDSCRTRAKY